MDLKSLAKFVNMHDSELSIPSSLLMQVAIRNNHYFSTESVLSGRVTDGTLEITSLYDYPGHAFIEGKISVPLSDEYVELREWFLEQALLILEERDKRDRRQELLGRLSVEIQYGLK